MGYMDRPQSEKKKRNIERVVEYFDSHGGNIDEIANALGLSRSSTQRYLNDSYVAEIRSVEEARLIKEYLLAMKNEGNVKGGQKSTSDSRYVQDESGKFRGSRRI